MSRATSSSIALIEVPEVVDGDILLRLRKAGHDGGDFCERAAVQGVAEQERRNQTVTGHMSVEPDQVSGLFAAEDASLPPQRLENVTVADVGGDDAHAVARP